MVTARPARSATRNRPSAGALRLLWLAALLLSFLYTHAAGAESASAHVTLGAAAAEHSAPDADHADHRDLAPDGHDGSHPEQACAAGQPQHCADLPLPRLLPYGELTPDARSAIRAGRIPALFGPPPPRSSGLCVVQQV